MGEGHPLVADLSDPGSDGSARPLKQWREAFLAYFDTGRANNGGTEAINGLIEPHRRIARGFRNREHYRLRMLLIGGGLTHPRLR
ncbi:transposase [Nocardioides carbamazepini]|nr:transposase [Nocardioides carbamazepini]